jgi:UrcA family protein
MSHSERVKIVAMTLSTAVVATALAGTAIAARAAPTDDRPQAVVRYDDLNLASDAGTHVLLRRLRQAAHRVCDIPGTREMTLLIASRSCYQQALQSAVHSVHNERLSSLYQTTQDNGPS